MKHLVTFFGALLLVSAVPDAAAAQTTRFHLGPRLSYHLDAEKVGIGVQLGVPVAQQLELYPSFDYFLVDAGSFVHLNADLKFRITQESLTWLYLGGGLNVARASYGRFDDTNAGLNLFFGAETLTGRVHPFGELRLVSNNGSTAVIAVGLNFTLRS